MEYEKLLSRDRMLSEINRASLVVCHGGMGIIGDAMRASKKIICFPRIVANTTKNPANNQLEVVDALSKKYGFKYANNKETLKEILLEEINNAPPHSVSYNLKNNIPSIIANFLST